MSQMYLVSQKPTMSQDNIQQIDRRVQNKEIYSFNLNFFVFLVKGVLNLCNDIIRIECVSVIDLLGVHFGMVFPKWTNGRVLL